MTTDARGTKPPPTLESLNEDDQGVDAETLIVVGELRRAFPSWTISYSAQIRAWIARAHKKTICQNSAVSLSIALTLIDRKERQAGAAPGLNSPSGAAGSRSSWPDR